MFKLFFVLLIFLFIFVSDLNTNDMDFYELFCMLNDDEQLKMRVDEILNLNRGNLIKILGLSEVPGQDYDDVLVIEESPTLFDNYIIINFTYPSGKEGTEEVHLDLLEDITIV